MPVKAASKSWLIIIRLLPFLPAVGPGGRGLKRRDFSCEAVEIGPQDVEHPAHFGVMPYFVRSGLLVPPRITQRLDRDVDADPVSEAETVGDGLGDGINSDRDALDDVLLDAR